MRLFLVAHWCCFMVIFDVAKPLRDHPQAVSQSRFITGFTTIYFFWLVVWTIFYFSIYWEFHHPNWLKPPAVTNRHQPSPTVTNRHQPSPTVTNQYFHIFQRGRYTMVYHQPVIVDLPIKNGDSTHKRPEKNHGPRIQDLLSKTGPMPSKAAKRSWTPGRGGRSWKLPEAPSRGDQGDGVIKPFRCGKSIYFWDIYVYII